MKGSYRAGRTRTLYYSDNLPVLQRMPSEFVDLIYLDPPFNSKRAYNIIYPNDLGQVQAFDDTWMWTPLCDLYVDELQQHPHAVQCGAPALVSALVDALGKVQICAYTVNMCVRLVELHRILKPTGTLYLHCDPTASHYLKIVLDAIFGQKNFKNEIVWCYAGGGIPTYDFPRKHDIILRYTKKDKGYFYRPVYREYSAGTKQRGRTAVKGKYFEHGLRKEGTPMNDWWTDVPKITSPTDSENLGYPTQKSLALLERLLFTSSQEGDLVLDPFCGCGTTVAAAEKLHRNWIGIDITYSSIAAIQERFRRDRIDIWQQIELIGAPSTTEQIEEKFLNQTSPLFARKEFEKFCVATIGGLPNDKMGADGGIDGRIQLRSVPERAICSVKSGQVGVSQLRDLKGLLGVKKADVAGVFISRYSPTQPMRQFANQAGVHAPKSQDLFMIDPFPRLQILTLEEILNGKRPALPYLKAA